MKSRLVDTDAHGGRTFVLVFDQGEEALAGLKVLLGRMGSRALRSSPSARPSEAWSRG